MLSLSVDGIKFVLFIFTYFLNKGPGKRESTQNQASFDSGVETLIVVDSRVPRFWEQESGSNIGCQNRADFPILTSPLSRVQIMDSVMPETPLPRHPLCPEGYGQVDQDVPRAGRHPSPLCQGFALLDRNR